jgi:hypothetical protein
MISGDYTLTFDKSFWNNSIRVKEKNKYIEEILENYCKEIYLLIYDFSIFPEVLCKIIHSYI